MKPCSPLKRRPIFDFSIILLIALFPGLSLMAGVSDEVDPFIGVKGEGACMPGPCLPHGSIHPSPNTLSADNGGYNPSKDITGFAHLHAQGTGGVPSYGNFLISPQLGLKVQESQHGSARSDESAKAYRYGVTLSRYGIRCDIVPSRHSALYRFVFPASDNAHFAFNIARKINGSPVLQKGSVRIDRQSRVIEGGGTFDGNWCAGAYQLFFHAKASRSFDGGGTWVDSTIRQDIDSAGISSPSHAGAFVKMKTAASETLYVKIAVSFASIAQARAWLDAEIPSWDLNGLESKARGAWDTALGRISLEGADQSQTRMFYTALFHTLVQPRDRTADFVKYGTAELWDDHYTLWDTWRSVFPLLQLVDPVSAASVVRGFITRFSVIDTPKEILSTKIYPKVETAFTQGAECLRGQGGDEVDNVIADAFTKGLPGVDWTAAYRLMRHNARAGRSTGYRAKGYFAAGESFPDWRGQSGSSTPAFAYNDFCVALMAKGLGNTQDATTYLIRSGNWKNTWNPTAADNGFTGFMVPRNNDGTFPPINMQAIASNPGYYEGSAWIYSYLVPHDVPGLITAMGGRSRFVERLNFAFSKNLIDCTNEPSFLTPWLYNYALRPDLCAEKVRGFIAKFTASGYPGDEDAGAMSSAYIFCTAGFFPNAGQPLYLLCGPLFPKITFHFPNGKSFTIIGVNAGTANPYVQSAALNGEPLERCWILHKEILTGGELSFVMGPKPSDWAKNGPVPPSGLDSLPITTTPTPLSGRPLPEGIAIARHGKNGIILTGKNARAVAVHTIDGKTIASRALTATTTRHRVDLPARAGGAIVVTVTGASGTATRLLLTIDR